MWVITMNMDRITLTDTMYQFICYTGCISRHYYTLKYHFQYNQLTKKYEKLFTDYLRVGVLSIIHFIGNTVYAEKKD